MRRSEQAEAGPRPSGCAASRPRLSRLLPVTPPPRPGHAPLLVGAAGELGVAHARRQEAADAVAEAAAAGRGLVQAAEAEAAALRDRAQAEVATAAAGYAGAWQ